MIVREVMSSNPVTIDPNAFVFTAARLMRDKRIGSLIVVQNEKVVGIVTERDLVRRVLAVDKDPKKFVVGDIMSSPVISINPKENVIKAAQLMKRRGIRRLAVMENGLLLGVVTSNDLVDNMKRAVDDLALTPYMMDSC